MHALPCSDQLTDIPEAPPTCRFGRPPQADRLAPSRSLLRASYAEVNRMAFELLRVRRSARSLDPRTLINEAARRTLGASGLQDLADPAGYLAFLANSLRRMLVELTDEGVAADGEPPDVWLYLPGMTGGTHLVTLLDALDRLEDISPRHAQTVVLKAFGGLSDAEVAAQLGVTPQRAAVGWSRASEWLRMACSAPRP